MAAADAKKGPQPSAGEALLLPAEGCRPAVGKGSGQGDCDTGLGDHLHDHVHQHSSGSLSSIVINDATPAYTLFQSAACGTPLPTGVTGCSVTTQPGAGAAGTIQWTLTGNMNSAQTGTVTFSVKVD